MHYNFPKEVNCDWNLFKYAFSRTLNIGFEDAEYHNPTPLLSSGSWFVKLVAGAARSLPVHDNPLFFTESTENGKFIVAMAPTQA